MRIVSENSTADLAKRAAEAEINAAIIRLTANLLRIARGAGKPSEVGRDCQAFVAALLTYKDAVGQFPPGETIAQAIVINEPHLDYEHETDAQVDKVYAEHSILRACLQVVASQLVEQRMQESSARNDLYMAIALLERARAEIRKAHQAEMRAAERPMAKRTRKTNAKPSEAKPTGGRR